MACFKYRKKQQRKVNKIIKRINKRMKEDTLWRGRFQVKQINAQYVRGQGLFHPCIQLIDKKTSRTVFHWMTYLFSDSFETAIFIKLNTFIVDYCEVWSEKPGPLEQTEIYY